MGILRKFLDWNTWLSTATDQFLPVWLRQDGNRCFLDEYAPRLEEEGATIWDVGSGSQPYLSPARREALGATVVGLDISHKELAAAPAGAYSRTVVADVCRFSGEAEADSVICQALLEHVPDTQGAIRALASIVRPGGHIYLFVPSRNAVFARINLVLPQGLKRRILFTVFPAARHNQGFQVWYDNCTPRHITRIALAHGLVVEEQRLFWISSYFKPFFPAFLAWRLLQGLVWLVLGSQAAESFVLVLRKPE
jgi:SAM-dependent methyltransferase